MNSKSLVIILSFFSFFFWGGGDLIGESSIFLRNLPKSKIFRAPPPPPLIILPYLYVHITF